MNTVITSRADILKTCREIVSKEGLSALNMRHVAAASGVALGSIYHYFSSKDEMITATVESVWRDVFHIDFSCRPELPFPAYVEWIFSCVRKSAEKYPNFFMIHSVSFSDSAKEEARQAMVRCFSHLKEGLLLSLKNDPGLKADAFSDAFKEEELIDFVFSSILLLLIQEKSDCSVLMEVIRRSIYCS